MYLKWRSEYIFSVKSHDPYREVLIIKVLSGHLARPSQARTNPVKQGFLWVLCCGRGRYVCLPVHPTPGGIHGDPLSALILRYISHHRSKVCFYRQHGCNIKEPWYLSSSSVLFLFQIRPSISFSGASSVTASLLGPIDVGLLRMWIF